MKLPIIHNIKTLSISAEKMNNRFTTSCLPLFYSGSIDLVMQNIFITLLGSLIRHIDFPALVQSIKSSIPGIKSVTYSSEAKIELQAYSFGNKEITVTVLKQTRATGHLPGLSVLPLKERKLLRKQIVYFIRHTILKTGDNFFHEVMKQKLKLSKIRMKEKPLFLLSTEPDRRSAIIA